MEDREMLRLAALAAGIEIDDRGVPFTRGTYEGQPTCDDWNPLNDDGEALRLAVRLKFDIEHKDGAVVIDGYLTRIDGDTCAAVRRAIVIRAAEEGSLHKESTQA